MARAWLPREHGPRRWRATGPGNCLSVGTPPDPRHPARAETERSSVTDVFEAAFWGFVGGVSLIIGAVLGLVFKVTHRTIGLVMGFGAGVLISAAAFELTMEAYEAAGGPAAAAGLISGSATFFAGDWLIDRAGGHRRKSPVHGGMPHPPRPGHPLRQPQPVP